jgi:large subunit ribosomal protein L23
MLLKPLLTEKSMADAKKGNYTFWVDKRMNKHQIKKLIGEMFGVTVVNVRTINLRGEKKKTYRGKIKIIKPRKKAIVVLKEKEKIDLFEEKKK